MDYFLFNFSGVQFHYTMSQVKVEHGKEQSSKRILTKV